MKTLNQTILAAARDEVAKKNNFNTWEDYIDDLNEYANGALRIEDAGEEAALLAMEKQAEFFRHISAEGWHYVSSEGYWFSMDLCGKNLTELELYEIFTTQQ